MNLCVRNFGPIKDVNYSIKDFNLLIGKQASGKSTITKLIYYFLNNRDEIYNLVIELLQSPQRVNIKNAVDKLLRNRFVEFFGPGLQSPDFCISFEYSEKLSIIISVVPPDHKMLKFKFSESLVGLITEIIRQNENKFKKEISRVKLFKSNLATSNDIELEKLRKQVEERINEYFGFSENLLFIPAGRSLLSTICDQLQLINPQTMDFPMRQFVLKIANTKAFFNMSVEDIIAERIMHSNEKRWIDQLTNIKNIMNKIIQGNFIHDRDGEKIVLPNGKYVKINFSSSGQQESVWIVLSLFLIVLERVNAIVFIEEPEAHLFPNAQKDIVDLIIYLRNVNRTKFVVTTHSPYILSAANNNIYAQKLKMKGKNIKAIIEESYMLDIAFVNADLVSDGEIQSIIDNEILMIDVGKIDNCSREINSIYSALEDLEFGNA